MKGFKHTGRGPSYGDHQFTSKHGFTGSTGQVRNVRSYSQATPKAVVAPACPVIAKAAGGAVNSCGTKKTSPKGPSSFFKDLMAKKK